MDLRQYQDCVFFLRGSCRNTSCPFAHDEVGPVVGKHISHTALHIPICLFDAPAVAPDQDALA